MRLVNRCLLAAAALAALPLPAQAQAQAQATATAPLAPGEVLAQVAGIGQVRSRPEIARFRLTVSAHADTAAAARAACAAALQDLRAKLRAAGVPDPAVPVLPPGNPQLGVVGNEAFGDDDAPNPAGAAALLAMARQRKTATIGVQIELTDMTRLAAVRQLLLERDDVAAQPPTLSLHDDTAARHAAVAQAIVRARAEADAYAAALGLHVARVARVFDPLAASEQPQVYAQVIGLMNGGTGNEVITDARVGMDVVLTPR